MDIYIALVAQIVAFIVWIVRLEMRVKFLQDSHEGCKKIRELAEVGVSEKLERIVESIAEMKTDIKWLINNNNSKGGSNVAVV